MIPVQPEIPPLSHFFINMTEYKPTNAKVNVPHCTMHCQKTDSTSSATRQVGNAKPRAWPQPLIGHGCSIRPGTTAKNKIKIN